MKTEQDALAATVALPSSGAQQRVVATGPIALAVDGARYEHGRELGRGGMGEVRLAEDRRIGREVAVKRMLGTDEQPEAVARFLREARVQGQLEHPSILPVYDLGLGQDGVPFFTMKRLRGHTLAEILAAGDTSRRKLLGCFASVCLAVEFAHTRGVVHRDLKPTNLMLGDFGEVYVLDWGVAKLAGDDGDRGAIMGTPGYMAPEQQRGEPTDARTDVWALGAILFEILAGVPFAKRSAALPIDRDVAPELDSICTKATASIPADRYPSVRALLDELERFLDGDRDLERRRVVAGEHAGRAAAFAAQALGGDDDARAGAMREAGRALALDPACAGALETISKLLVEPPRTTPPEVARALDVSIDESARIEAHTAGWMYLSGIVILPLIVWMGVRSWPLFGALAILIAIEAGCAFSFARWRRVPPGSLYGIMALNVGFLLVTSRLTGPYLIVPSLAASTTLSFVLHARIRAWIAMAMGCLAVAVPIVLEWTGAISPTTTIRHGALVVHPVMATFPPQLAMAAIGIVTVAYVLPASIFLDRVARQRLAAERRLLLTSWHLRHLVPDGNPANPGG